MKRYNEICCLLTSIVLFIFLTIFSSLNNLVSKNKAIYRNLTLVAMLGNMKYKDIFGEFRVGN